MKKKPTDPDIMTCPRCGCSFFEQITLAQYPKFHNVIVGQAVQRVKDISFQAFRCARCSELLEPTVLIGPQTQARREYDEFWAEMSESADGEQV